MGCPARTVTQHGSGAALIGKPQLASQIIKSVQKAVTDFTSGQVKIGDLGLNKKLLKQLIEIYDIQFTVHRLLITSPLFPSVKPVLVSTNL